MPGGVELATAYVSIVASAGGLGGSIRDDLRGAESDAAATGARSGSKFVAAFGGITAAGLAVAAVGKGLYEVGATFDNVSDTIRVGTGKTGEALNSLVASAEKVGTQVPASFEDASTVVTGLNQRLGLSGTTLETVASQYLAAGNILGQQVDINATTAAFTAFGIKGDAVSGAMDRLFQVSQATGVGFNELAGSVQSQAPALQALGFSFDQTAGLIGNLDKAGLNSQAITASMGKGLVKLAKQGEEPQAAFQRITAQIGELVAAGNTAGAIDLASGIFGTKGATQFVAAVQSGTIATGDLGAVAGITSDTILGAAKDTADFSESLQLFKNNALLALKPAGEAVFGALSKAMAAAATAIVPIATAISAVVTGLLSGGDLGSSVFGKLAPLLSVIGPILNPIGFVLKSLLPVLPVLGQSFMEIAKAIGGALMQALQALAPLLPVIADAFSQIGALIAGLVVAAVQMLVPIIAALADVFAALMPTISTLISSLMPPLMSIFQAIVPLVAAVVMIVTEFAQLLGAILPPIIRALLPIIQAVFAAIGPIVQAAMEIVRGIIEVVTGIISGNWTLVWTGIKDFFGGIWDLINAVVSGAVGILEAVLSAAWSAIMAAAAWAWDLVKSFIINPLQAAWDWITGVFSAVGGWISGNIWAPIMAAASWAWGLVKTFIVNPLQEAWNWITGVFGAIVGWIDGNIWSPIKGAAAAAWQFVKDKIIGPLQEAMAWVENTFSTIVGKIQNIWEQVKKTLTGNIVANVQANITASVNNITAPGTFLGIGNPFKQATGGVWNPVRGGSPVIVGESGQQEIIAPTPLLKQVFSDVLTAHSAAGGGAAERNVTINLNHYGPGDLAPEAVVRALKTYERTHAFA